MMGKEDVASEDIDSGILEPNQSSKYWWHTYADIKLHIVCVK